MIRRLIVLSLLAASAYGGYWFIGATAMERGVAHWLQDRRADGWVAEWEELNVAGFPSRFDMTVEGLELADPRSGWAWDAPFFQTLALSYRPTQVIAVWPHSQSLQTPLERLEITSENLRGSLALEPDSALALRRSSFEIDALGITSSAGWVSALEQARLASRVVPEDAETALTHQVSFSARAWTVPSPLLARLDAEGILPDRLDQVQADLTLRFDAPWDRYAIERARPQPREVKITLAEAHWGQLALKLAGEFTVNEGGQPEGEVMVKATNWREMLSLGVSAGVIPAEMEGTIEGALGLLSQMTGGRETLDIPLRFSTGKTWLGPVPIGPAPVIRLR